MPRSASFRDMETAPRDGTAIEVRYGPDQVIVRAEWSGQAQAWVRVDDPRVTGWRPVKWGGAEGAHLLPG